MWGALIAGVFLAGLAWACGWMLSRPDPRIAAMPDESDPVEFWPLTDDGPGTASPYLRGQSHAGSLTGRR